MNSIQVKIDGLPGNDDLGNDGGLVCVRLYWSLSRNTGSGRLYGEHSDILIRESSFKERGYGDKRRFGKEYLYQVHEAER